MTNIYNIIMLISIIILTIGILKYLKLIKKISKHKSTNWKLLLSLLLSTLITNISSILIILTFGSSNITIISTLLLNMIYFNLYILITLRLVNDFKYINNLEQDNITDKLMGIYNRRYFDIAIEEKFNFCNNYNIPLSIIFIDIDNFKLINDNYGHLIGDEVLKHCATSVKKSIRTTDLFCRYGGEEVVIVCENTNLNGAYILAEKIRTIIENSPYIINESLNNNMIEFGNKLFYTISIGISQNSKYTTNVKSLIEIADKNLYVAKQKGKNITIY